MSVADSSEAAARATPGWLRRLGWQHRGFRAKSAARATLGLCLLLTLPFALDQWAFLSAVAAPDLMPDIEGWLDNARVLLADPSQPFYEEHGAFYIYPPFFLTLIWPLTKLPVLWAAAVFQTVKWIALVVSCRLAWRIVSPAGEDVPPIVALGSLVLTWRFMQNDLGVGNVNLLLLVAMLGGCWLLLRGRPVLAGAAVALAASIKVTPALLLVYFAYKRWWKTLVGAAIALAACLVVWPALWLGWDNNLDLLQGWYEAIVAGFLERGAVRSEHTNQALVGILNRLFGPHVAILPDRHLTLVVLPEWVRNVVRFALALGIIASAAWICRGRLEPRRRPPVLGAEVSLVLIAMLLLSGLSWKAHFVTLLLPYSLLLAYAADARAPACGKRGLLVLLGLSFAFCTLTSDILTPTGADYAEAFGLIALGAVLAGVAVARVRTELRRCAWPFG